MWVRGLQRPAEALRAVLEVRTKGATLRLPARENTRDGYQAFPVERIAVTKPGGLGLAVKQVVGSFD